MKNTKVYIQWFAKTLVLLMAVTMFAAPITVLADNDNDKPASTQSITEIGQKVNNELGEVEATIIGTAWAVAPIALLVAIIGMCLTHEPKKVAMLLKVCGSIIAAAAGIIAIEKDYAFDVLKNMMERFF